MPNSETQEKRLRPGQFYRTEAILNEQTNEVQTLQVVAQVPVAPPPIEKPPMHEYFDAVYNEVEIEGFTGWRAAVALARMTAWRYPTLMKFIQAFDELCHPVLHPEYAGRSPLIEDACSLAKISEEDLMGDVAKASYFYGVERAKQFMYARLPQVIKASYDSAVVVGKDGFSDRKLLLEAGGLISQGGGTNVNVQVNNSTKVGVIGLPKWEDSDKLLNGKETS